MSKIENSSTAATPEVTPRTPRIWKRWGRAVLAGAVAAGIVITVMSPASPSMAFPPKVNFIDRYAGGGTVDWGVPTALSAKFDRPWGMASDSAGNLFVADTGRVRMITASPVSPVSTNRLVGTIAGDGTPGYSGDGGLATDAHVSPNAVAVDSFGNVFIAEGANNRVRRVDATTHIITTYAGTGSAGPGLGGDGDHGPATSAAISNPSNLAIDSAGNLYITALGDSLANNVVRKVDFRTGIITTLPLPKNSGFTLAVDATDALFFNHGSTVQRYDPVTGAITIIAGDPAGGVDDSGDGGPATSAHLLANAIAVDRTRNYLYISTNYNYSRIRGVDLNTGIITTVVGTGTEGETGDPGPALNADIQSFWLAVNPAGLLYTNSGVYKTIRVIACGAVGGYGFPVTQCLR